MKLELLEAILRDICDMEPHSWGFDPPPICDVLAGLPVRHMTKTERNVTHHEKVKTTTGYVWIEGDREKQLLNKSGGSTSCHSLHGGGQWRGGNANYVMSPYFACIMAGRVHPDEDREWRAIHDPTLGRSRPLRVSPYNALANLFVMFRAGSPYLFMSRLYDSQSVDYPWDRTMVKFLADHCRAMGFGLAVSSDACRREVREQFTTHGRGHDVQVLRTPPFRAPGELGYPWYSDAGLALRYARTAGGGPLAGVSHWYYETAGGIILADPVSGLWEGHCTPAMVDDPDPHGYGSSVDCEEKSPYSCDYCGDGLTEDETHSDEDGNHTFCRSCYSDRYTTCDECSRTVDRESLNTVRTGSHPSRLMGYEHKWCQSCYEDRAMGCDSCEDTWEDGAMVRVGGEDAYSYFCPPCVRDETFQCAECGDPYPTADGETIDPDPEDGEGEPSGPYCPDCYREIVNPTPHPSQLALPALTAPPALTGEPWAGPPPPADAGPSPWVSPAPTGEPAPPALTGHCPCPDCTFYRTEEGIPTHG